MHKKIKFDTLQRFDLKDANELQEGVLNKQSTLTKGFDPHTALDTLKWGGPLSKVTVQGVSNGIVTFGPLKVVTAAADSVIGLTQTDVDEGFTQVDISAVYNSFIDQNNNGAGLTGIYFYAYPLIEDSDVESRQFYNIIEAQAEGRNVATRERTRLTFFASIDPSYFVADANGNLPIYLGHVKTADILTNNSSSPFIPTNFKSYNYFGPLYGEGFSWDDTGLPNAGDDDFSGTDNLSDGNTYSGLRLAFERLRRQLNRIVSYGTNDRADAEVLATDTAPRYSLQGLYREMLFFDNIQNTTLDTLTNKNKVANVVYVWDFRDLSAGAEYYFFQDSDANDFAITGDVDWTNALESSAASAPTDWDSVKTTAGIAPVIGQAIVLELPSGNLGDRIISVTGSVISPLHVSGIFEDNEAFYDTSVHWARYSSVASLNYNEFATVQTETWRNGNDEVQTGPAIKIKIGPESQLAQSSTTLFAIQFTITLDTRS